VQDMLTRGFFGFLFRTWSVGRVSLLLCVVSLRVVFAPSSCSLCLLVVIWAEAFTWVLRVRGGESCVPVTIRPCDCDNFVTLFAVFWVVFCRFRAWPTVALPASPDCALL
jgi:hypothetical protein